MPVEIKDLDEFVKITERALECRVKRSRKEKGVVKVKARTKRYLYTYKTSEDKLNEVLSKVKCKKIIDVDEGKEIKVQASQ
jgi:large subunit ribosomal protein L38e